MDFLTKDDILLLQHIENYPVIYDKTSINYKNNNVRENVFKKIASQIKKPGNYQKYKKNIKYYNAFMLHLHISIFIYLFINLFISIIL